MQNANFRKLDVDAFNEDQYKEDEDAETTPSLGPDESEINNMLQQNRLTDALRAALRNPPHKTKNQVSFETNDQKLQSVCSASICYFSGFER